jgi:hypothetical protein
MLAKTDLKAYLKRLIDSARSRGVNIFYVPHGLHKHSIDEFLEAVELDGSELSRAPRDTHALS